MDAVAPIVNVTGEPTVGVPLAEIVTFGRAGCATVIAVDVVAVSPNESTPVISMRYDPALLY